MGFYYTFIRPWDLKVIAEGKYAGIPFYYNDIKTKIPMFPDDNKSFDAPYSMNGFLDRPTAIELQKEMNINETLFTDLMDEYNTDCLFFRIQ